jgi:CubicO group peptidase (beta-lactamase class C family)
MDMTSGVTGDFHWQTGEAIEHGFRPDRLETLCRSLAARRTRAFLLVRHDRIVCEWYAPDFGPTRRHYTASLAKSLVGGLALTLALQDGLCGLDDFACDYVGPWQCNPAKSLIRLRHLATHCSGLDDASEGQTPHGRLPAWKGMFWKRRPLDPFTIARDQAPLVAEPGTRFLYSNPGSAMLAYALTVALKETPHRDLRCLLRERLFRPIGLEDIDWQIGYDLTFEVDGLPLVPNWAGGMFTARATARIGRLLLKHGTWQGRQLLDPARLEECTRYAGNPVPDRTVTPAWPAPTAGWWSNHDGTLQGMPVDAWCGAGSGNQMLAVIPSLDMLVVRYGGYMGEPPEHLNFWTGLQEGLFGPLMGAMR